MLSSGERLPATPLWPGGAKHHIGGHAPALTQRSVLAVYHHFQVRRQCCNESIRRQTLGEFHYPGEG